MYRVVGECIAKVNPLLHYWFPSPLRGVALVALVALLSPIVIMVLDGATLGGFDIVEGHGLVGARVEIGTGRCCWEGAVGVVVGWYLEWLVGAAVGKLERLVAIVVLHL